MYASRGLVDTIDTRTDRCIRLRTPVFYVHDMMISGSDLLKKGEILHAEIL